MIATSGNSHCSVVQLKPVLLRKSELMHQLSTLTVAASVGARIDEYDLCLNRLVDWFSSLLQSLAFHQDVLM